MIEYLCLNRSTERITRCVLTCGLSLHSADEQVNIVPMSMVILDVAEISILRVSNVATICTEMSLCQMGGTKAQHKKRQQVSMQPTVLSMINSLPYQPIHLFIKNIAMQNANQRTSSLFTDTVLHY